MRVCDVIASVVADVYDDADDAWARPIWFACVCSTFRRISRHSDSRGSPASASRSSRDHKWPRHACSADCCSDAAAVVGVRWCLRSELMRRDELCGCS